MNDTIFALATAPGRGAVAVIRLSGPGAVAMLGALTGRVPRRRRAALRRLRDQAGEVLDEALVLRFDGPASFTGEDCVELQLHGGAGVVDAVSRALLELGARLAGPGEFTRRAFEAGRMDLSQAEAVADLVDAETRAQARQAVDQLDGALGRRHRAWRSALVEGLSKLEAAIDFPDDLAAEAVVGQARAPLVRLRQDLVAAVADAQRGRRVREGFKVAVMGAPNSGKSSLVNRLAEREVAIVSPVAGTTRDVIEVPVTLAGYRVVLGDAAGLRAARDPVEAEGVRRARAWAEDAALRLWVVDAASSGGDWRLAASLARPGDLCLLNKADLYAGADAELARDAAAAGGLRVLHIAALGGDVEAVREAIASCAVASMTGADFPAVTRERHRRLLGECLGHLDRGLDRLDAPELAAEDVRLAARALGRVVGAIGAEAVLDEVFASFCLGK